MRELEDSVLSSRTFANSARPISQNGKQEEFNNAEFRRKSLAMFMEEAQTLEQYYANEEPSGTCIDEEVIKKHWKVCDSSISDPVLTYRGANKAEKASSDLSNGGSDSGDATAKHILDDEKKDTSAGFDSANGQGEHGNGTKKAGTNEAEDAAVAAAHDEFGLGGMFHCCAGQRRLLHVEQMPDHLQFNKFVRTGYRDIQGAWDCFMSLFYLHNETVNIFTHVAPIFVVLYYWRSMFPWEDIEGHTYFNFLGWSHVIGSISPWLGSVVYHLFMNHLRGPKFYTFLLQMDMFGIWVAQCFGAMTNLTASTWCLSDNVQIMWMGIYAVASVWGLHKALTARSALGRRLCFAMVFISRLFGFALRISKYGGGNPEVLTHVILQDVVSVVGGFIGVVRIPELWFPGKLDLFFNSHHIMHVMVVLAVFHMNQATNGDIRWILDNYSKGQCVTLL